MKTCNFGAPIESIAIDMMGALPVPESGNKYIWVISDYFTKWTEYNGILVPVRTSFSLRRRSGKTKNVST